MTVSTRLSQIPIDKTFHKEDLNLAIDNLRGQSPTPLVLALLGELQQDPELLIQSWELSRHTYSRAQRSLGKMAVRKGEWANAIVAYQLALALNGLYPDVWFSRGCSHMRLEQFTEAVVCFQQVVNQKQDDGESFSNLAICLMQVGKLEEAHKALTQAIRFDRTNAKVWENYLILSLHPERLGDVLMGLEELTRSVPKWCNVPLIHDIYQTLLGKDGDLQRFAKVLDVVAERSDGCSSFFAVFCEVLDQVESYERAIEMCQSAVKTLEANGRVTDPADFGRLVSSLHRLAELARKVPSKLKGAKQRLRVVLKHYQDSFGADENYHRLQSLADSLQ
jgi:tetratricopeptide (TPR) repeat protein